MVRDQWHVREIYSKGDQKMNWKQMTIGRKIAAGFGVVLVLLAAVGI